ncbi:alanine racemase [Ghiorsea bivora]|uniref:alanine racemase n=1 Tax=Ghiorsea bivora TaxID=1485545 RepID=UPI0005707CC8|nr:alanine racemase [Ghiorsea bivora]
MRPATLIINLQHLAWNYHLLQKHAGETNIMAVVKANAYGHGLLPIANTLYQEGCRNFAVTDAYEGETLRSEIPQDSNIVLFSGVFDAEDAALCQKYALTPVIALPEQLTLLHCAGFTGKLWLKVDTGMSRIGATSPQTLIKQIPPSMRLAGMMSHLACADEPKHALNQQQIKQFKTLQQTIQAPAYSLFNSAGLIAFAQHINTDIARPGLALYGIEPIASKALGLKPIMQLRSQVMQIRDIQKGETVSYGATWSAPQDMRIAIVALGYADGLPRLLSNQGQAWIHGQLLPIVGRVCMDYCMLAINQHHVQVGDEVVFFGYHDGQPSANHVATQCQTISYELFTQIPSRVPRTYVKE